MTGWAVMRIPQATRVVVADSACARFFSVYPRNDLQTEGRRYMAGHSRQPGIALTEDVPALVAEPGRTQPSVRHDLGRSFESGAAARHIIEPHTDDKTLDQAEFAAWIGMRVQADCATEPFQHLLLAAPPQMLGVLRQHLPEDMRAKVAHAVAGEWAHLSIHEIENRVWSVLSE